MSLYLDTSCLWKLLVDEPESARVREIVGKAPKVVISSYTEFEAAQVLMSLRLGGCITARREARIGKLMAEFRGMEPFQHRGLPYDLSMIARQQVIRSSIYCRTADRLHLAAMEALGLDRLLTNDEQQAAAARALGYRVVLPR